MKATVKDGKLIIELDLAEKPLPSASGKTLLLATTHGGVPAQVGSQVAKIAVNVTIPNPAYKGA